MGLAVGRQGDRHSGLKIQGVFIHILTTCFFLINLCRKLFWKARNTVFLLAEPRELGFQLLLEGASQVEEIRFILS